MKEVSFFGKINNVFTDGNIWQSAYNSSPNVNIPTTIEGFAMKCYMFCFSQPLQGESSLH